MARDFKWHGNSRQARFSYREGVRAPNGELGRIGDCGQFEHGKMGDAMVVRVDYIDHVTSEELEWVREGKCSELDQDWFDAMEAAYKELEEIEANVDG